MNMEIRRKIGTLTIIAILMLGMFIGMVQFGNGTMRDAGILGVCTSLAFDSSGCTHIGYREEDIIESLPDAILCEAFNFGAEAA